MVFAVALGFCTWLYTYRRDAWKFWVAFAGLILFRVQGMSHGYVVLWLWAVIDVVVKPKKFYTHYYGT